MFHVPLNKRGIVSTERFSYPGHPCLYLSHSVESCWYELGRPSSEEFYVSAFKVHSSFRVLDLRIPSMSDYTNGNVAYTLKRLPLVIACSFIVKNKTASFKPEYIIPQFLLESIVSRSNNLIKDTVSISDIDVIWGVTYTSHLSHFCNKTSFTDSINIALPVVLGDRVSNHCHYLAYLFKITTPICLGDDDIINNASGCSRFTIAQYLLSRKRFYQLPYLLISTPLSGIQFPAEGGTINLTIQSNLSWEIK